MLTINPLAWETSNLALYCISVTKAQLRRRTFNEPNLVPAIKFMKSLASELVKNGYLNVPNLVQKLS